MDRLQNCLNVYLVIAVCIIAFIGCTEVRFNNPYETGGTKPMISLNGEVSITLTLGEIYYEKWYTASDNDGKDLTSQVTFYVLNANNDTVNIYNFFNQIGTYTIYYTVTNANRITAWAERKVLVLGLVDSIPPVITVLGKDPEEIYHGQPYTDPGATALDRINDSTIMDLTALIVTTNNVNPWIIGTYEVSYYVEDTARNSDTKNRTVHVKIIPDTTPPVITMKGFDTVRVNYKGFYIDSGASAYDIKDGPVQAIPHGLQDINTDSLGTTFVVFYTASDNAGNEADTVRRYVIIADLEGPVIYLLGSDPQNLGVGWPYVEDSAYAIDAVDGTIPFARFTVENYVNTAIAGTYIVRYKVSDAANNPAVPVDRIVNVVNPQLKKK